MDGQNLAERLRGFFRTLFGSRLVAQLEEDLMRQRGDAEERLQEREQTIAELRGRVALLEAKIERYEGVLLPLTSPIGNLFKQKREHPPFESLSEPPGGTWEAYQAQYYAQQAREDEAQDAEKHVEV